MRSTYALAAFFLFVVEVLIAVYVRDRFIRPYLGDVLAVFLVYCSIMAVFPINVRWGIVATLSFATFLEVGQAIGLRDMLGLGGNPIAGAVLGGSFDPMDFLAYGAAAMVIAIVEALRRMSH